MPPRSSPSTAPSRPSDAGSSAITRDLLAWYDRHRRTLPWRAGPGQRPDPYAVWLSEIMLQQTTVAAVKPFYTAFLTRWPTVAALAAAPTPDVMQAWAGLGYYSRARNLHACAARVVTDHGGAFPDTEAGLRSLPGVGAYTAAAVAAIAFGRFAVVVDGNVERVMARLHAVETPLPAAKPILTRWMAEATSRERPGDFAQATMDLGATICTPRSPACAICPLLTHCAAARAGLQGELPRKTRKTKTVLRHGTAICVLNARGDVLVRTRPPRGLLGGMAELPGPPWSLVTGEPAPPTPVGGVPAGRVVHVFTHFTLYLDVVLVRQDDEGDWPEARWVARDALDQEPWPTLMRRALSLGLKAADGP